MEGEEQERLEQERLEQERLEKEVAGMQAQGARRVTHVETLTARLQTCPRCTCDEEYERVEIEQEDLFSRTSWRGRKRFLETRKRIA